MQTADYCRDAAAPPGSSFHYATLFQTPEQRRALNALFALLAEVDAALRNVQDAAVGRLRLQWWNEEIARVTAAQTHHPVGLELRRLLEAVPAMAAELRAFVAAALAFVDDAPPATYADWIDRFRHVHGQLWAIAARHSAGSDGEAIAIAAQIGALLAALEELQQLPLSLRTGRCMLPVRELERHGLSAADIHPADRDGKVSEYLRRTLTQLRPDLLQAEREMHKTAPRPLLYCAIMARLAAKLCVELEDEGALILQHRSSLTPIRKLLIAWWTRIS